MSVKIRLPIITEPSFCFIENPIPDFKAAGVEVELFITIKNYKTLKNCNRKQFHI